VVGARHDGKEMRVLSKDIPSKPLTTDEAALLTDRAAVRRAFHGAANAYDAAAVVQREIADRMLERLDLVKLMPSRMLDAGSGTGYAGPKLRERFKSGRLIELDIALGMLQAARDKSSFMSRLLGRNSDSVCADLEAIPLQSASVELVWSNLAIQWLNEPDRAFKEFHRILKPKGCSCSAPSGRTPYASCARPSRLPTARRTSTVLSTCTTWATPSPAAAMRRRSWTWKRSS